MHLVLFLLSFLFASYAPTAPTTNDDNGNGTTTQHEPGKGKGGNYNDGDYVIWSDVHP